MTRRPGRSGPSAEAWRHWWRFNRDEFLNLRVALSVDSDAVQSGSDESFFGKRVRSVAGDVSRVTPALVRTRIAPRLVEALGAKESAVRYQAAIALGKTGDTAQAEHLVRLLRDDVGAVREGAMIGLAILRAPAMRALFVAILENKRSATLYLGGHANDEQLRGAAALGLGLLGTDLIGETVELLRRHAMDRRHTHHVPQMAVVALGLIDSDGAFDRAAAALRDVIADKGGHGWARGQALVALGRLIERHQVQGQRTERDRGLILRYLRPDATTLMRRSAALAAGYLPGDAALSKSLRRTIDRDKDAVTRNFAAISLGRAGGPDAEKTLVSGLGNARHQHRAYCAFGLAILGKRGDEATRTRTGKRLRMALHRTKDPATRGAVALALGLVRDRDAGAELLEALRGARDPDLRGDCAIALGMVGYHRAYQELVDAFEDAGNDAALRERVAIALGLFGSRAAVTPLLAAMRNDLTTSALQSTTAALGLVGDSSAVEPILELLDDRRLITRAYACTALGTIGDPRPMPAFAPIRTSHNYFSCCRDFNRKLLELDR